jgi:pSer/pThr/pTyr-binding forkhead associated (FHA) protein
MTSLTSSGPLVDRTRRHAATSVGRLAPGRYLAIEDGEEVVIVALEKPVVRIGRSPASDVQLDDASVSRRHALLIREHDGVHLVDDRSLNGVEVNGDRITRAVLRDGDAIAIGRVRLRFLDVPV